MAAYLSAAKQAEIVKNYNFALHTSSLQTLLVEMAAAIAQAGVSEISETIAFGDFTDGGGTSGTFALTAQIPAGALVIGALLTSLVGFTGDTSAVVTIGDGSDVDRYNTGTPNVFVTAAGGIDLGARSGVDFHDAAKTVTVTVTSAADFGAIVAGSMKVAIFYVEAD